VSQSGRVQVALFLSSFIPGGTERQMIELARRLDRSRFEVHLACFRREGPWLERAKGRVASIVEFPIAGFRRASTLAQMRAFARWCRRTGIAVLHTTDLYANVFGLPAGALAGVPVRIANRREINPDKRPGQIALQRAAYACAHRVVANSRAAADRLARERVPHGKIAVVPNGVDLDAFQPRALPARLRRVVTVANLRTEKAHDVLFEAAAALLARRPDAEFWIVGGGARYDELTALAARLGIDARTRFFGHRDDVPALLAESDVFVLPSRSEAFPGGLIEAMAAGLPVIATAVGGNLELIRHGTTGLLVPPGDPGALAAALHGLLESPGTAAELGRAARAWVEPRFSFDRMVSAFEDLYGAGLDAASRHVNARTELRGVQGTSPF
jgi:glycosyltransferase involved in cell wall biosynthesis